MAAKTAAASGEKLSFDLSKSGSQLMTVETVRMAFLAIVLTVTVIYQIVNSTFISFDVFFSVYLLLSVSFFLNCVYILFLEKVLRSWFWTALLFVWETIYVSSLIYLIGISQSLLVFLYLINIILCGVVFQRKGGVYLALVTSVAFSVLLALDSSIQGTALYLSVGVNNLAFFTVAYLSGYLSEQLNFMGVELIERGRDIRLLKNINSLVINSMDAGLLTVDGEGLILQHNDRALKILMQSNSCVGKSVGDLSPALRNLLTQAPQTVTEIRFGDDEKVLRASISALNDEMGERKGSILMFEDVTHLKKLEARVMQSEKMAAIGQLAAGIAHEIRNPLASISGSVQLLQVDASQGPDNQKLMGIVIKEIDRLNKLITEFLDYARPQSVSKKDVMISELLKEIIDAVRLDEFAKQVTFDLKFDSALVVEGQADKLKQALWNIVVNGLQAMESAEQKILRVSVAAEGESVAVRIRDSGSGISPQNIKKIFEPFHTTKPKGTGLGLAIVHSILETHGAQIEVKSQISQGTEFIILFKRKT